MLPPALHVNPKSSAPIWSQIEKQLQLLIAQGTLAPASPVPSVRELARQLVVNPATVSKAYQRLTEMGLLEVRRGQGTFVADSPSPAGNQLAERETERAAQQLAAVAKAAGLNLGQTRELLTESWHALAAHPGSREQNRDTARAARDEHPSARTTTKGQRPPASTKMGPSSKSTVRKRAGGPKSKKERTERKSAQ